MSTIVLLPPAFKLPLVVENYLALEERKAVDALLAGVATETHIDIVGSMAKIALRTSQKARKASHCKHLDKEVLRTSEGVMTAALATVKRIVARHAQTGSYACSFEDRARIQDLDEWYGALTRDVPRGVWLAALRSPARAKKPARSL